MQTTQKVMITKETVVLVQETMDQEELPSNQCSLDEMTIAVTASPALPTVSAVSNVPSSVHKGKKVFLERHSGQDQDEFQMEAISIQVTSPGSARASSPDIIEAVYSGTISTPIMNADFNGHETSWKRPTSSTCSDSGSDTKSMTKRCRTKFRNATTPKKSSEESEEQDDDSSNSGEINNELGSGSENGYQHKNRSGNNSSSTTSNPSSPKKNRIRKPLGDSKLYKKSYPFKRPPMTTLKKTGGVFVQDGSCNDVAPKLGKCRECRINAEKPRSKSDIFCRFFAFRKLRYKPNGTLTVVGFTDPAKDPTKDDLNLWLPSKTIPPSSLDFDMAKFLIDQLGDQFCELIRQDNEAIKEFHSDNCVAWKSVVEGVREMCDVCDTTLFNVHWACKKCGFVVCVACYRARKQGTIKIRRKKGKDPDRDRDEFNWLFCSANRTMQPHEMANLMLTHAIGGDASAVLCDQLHKMRAVYNMPQDCACDKAKQFCGQNIVEHSVEVTALPGQNSSDFQSSIKPTNHELNEEDDEDAEGFSALAAMFTEGDEPPDSKVNQVVSPEAQLQKPISESPTLTQYVRVVGPMNRNRKEPLPVQPYQLTATSQKYPDTEHSWLAYGRLLRLHNPSAPGNQSLFREVWIRGQPVIVSHVAEKLNKSLWSPEAFLQDFFDLKHDLVNCMTGRILYKQPLNRFWEGFEYVQKRLKDKQGNPMLLKLKDWPPGADFAESLPSRFRDLMKCLPLKDYTQRDGRLNLASRLPPNFVRPDLGPKMYIAYGSGHHLDKGTTNLHLDTSDAVNLMVHIGVPKDVDNEESKRLVLEAIEASDVDAFTVDRVRDGELPGALWHIYNYNDADKIRDFLNKVGVERGKKLEVEHDPIHDQNWYLDKSLRKRLVTEYDVAGFPMVQFEGDAVFIPAGAPHQVRNLHNCIKIAEDFVSPENVSHCFKLTEEFRDLTETHSNHEDKLQIKNIIYHACKDAVSILYQKMNDVQRLIVEGGTESHRRANDDDENVHQEILNKST